MSSFFLRKKHFKLSKMNSTKSKDDVRMRKIMKSFEKIKGRRLFPINYDLSSNAHHFDARFGKKLLNLTAHYDSSFFTETESDSESEGVGLSRELLKEQNIQPFGSREPSFTSDESSGDFPESPGTSCNLVSSSQLLTGKNKQTFVLKEPTFTPNESFSSCPESPGTYEEDVCGQTEDLQNEIGVRSEEYMDNSTRYVDETGEMKSLDFTEINDDEEIDFDANESFTYPHTVDCSPSGVETISNICVEETLNNDIERDPLMCSSPNDTFPTLRPPTSLDQSNSAPRCGRWVKLVSDFEDFAIRPFACALCYQRYSEFRQLAVHVKYHLTGGEGYGDVQTMAPFTC